MSDLADTLRQGKEENGHELEGLSQTQTEHELEVAVVLGE